LVAASAAPTFFDSAATTQTQTPPSANNTAQKSSGGTFVRETQGVGSVDTLFLSPTDLLQATYRFLARVKVDPGVTGSFKLPGGATVTAASTTWTWIDLGEAAISGGSFELIAWRSAGPVLSVYIDRVELHLITDRARATAQYNGARDQA